MTTSVPFLKSEHHTEFIWHNTVAAQGDDGPVKSIIKDKKLDKLKDAYKALAMRK